MADPGDSLYRPLSVGSVTLPGNLFLAPMAGYTDAAFRGICLDHGADAAYTEMVSCEALSRGNDKTLDLLARAAGEEFLIPQLFTGTEESIPGTLEGILPLKPAFIDLNAGCPVAKIVRSGAGSVLTKEPRRLEGLVKTLVRCSPVPVTVKIRSGWTDDEITFEEAALRAVDAGAAAVALHPRTRAQGYQGRARWEHIARLRRILPREIPVIASGDLFQPGDVLRVLEETGCDGVMIARGATGNPFIFQRSRRLLCTGECPPPPALEERISAAWDHIQRESADKGEYRGAKEMRKQVHAYFSGFPGASRVRREIVKAASLEDYRRILTDLGGSPPEG